MNKRICLKATVVFLMAFLILAAGCAKKQEGLRELLDLGQKYLLEENYEKAIVTFEKAIAVDERNADAYAGLADAYIGNKEADKAIEILEKGYELTQDESLKEKSESVREAAGDYDSSGGYGIKWAAGMPLSGLSCGAGFQEGHLGLEGSHGDIGEVATLIAEWWPAGDGLFAINVEEEAAYYLPLWKEEMPEFYPDDGDLFGSEFPADNEMGQEIYMLLLSFDRNYQLKAYSIVKIDLR